MRKILKCRANSRQWACRPSSATIEVLVETEEFSKLTTKENKLTDMNKPNDNGVYFSV